MNLKKNVNIKKLPAYARRLRSVFVPAKCKRRVLQNLQRAIYGVKAKAAMQAFSKANFAARRWRCKRNGKGASARFAAR
jgi:hypothetical protein